MSSNRDTCAKSPSELVAEFSSAVVQIQSEFILLGTGATGPINGETQLASNVRYDAILQGNGFFIENGYIVTPAHLVLLPPALSSVVNRYPYVTNPPSPLGVMQDKMIKASRVLVNVFGLRNNCVSCDGLTDYGYVYEATIVAIDGAGDIALLQIDPCRAFNRENPSLEHQKYFTYY